MINTLVLDVTDNNRSYQINFVTERLGVVIVIDSGQVNHLEPTSG